MERPLWVLVFLTLLGSLSVAQTPDAMVGGRVVDPSGAVVPRAKVVIVNDATNVEFSTLTNDAGVYSFPYVPPGKYHLELWREGFKRIVKPGIVLGVRDYATINFALEVGPTIEIVTVEGGVPLVNVTDGSVSTAVDRNYVENIPLNGRSFQDLILLTPGVVTTTPQMPATTGANGEFSVNGQRTESNYYTVDGVSANGAIYPRDPSFLGNSGSLPAATSLGTTQALVSVDALDEFRVESSTYSAEYGRNPGAQFSFATRSGTNQWHGTAFDYVRNDVFDANDWFNNYYAQPKPAERQNDFGGTLGGPVRIPGVYNGKDKTFFFLSYEGLRLTQPQAATLTYVPDTSLRTNTPGTLQEVMNSFPVPNGADQGNGLAEFVGTWSNPSSLDAVSLRLDQAIADKMKLFFRYSYTPSNSVARDTSAASQVDTTAFTTTTYTFGATTVLAGRWGNDLRLNYSSNAGRSAAHLDTFGGAQGADLARLQGIDTRANPDYQMSFLLLFGNQPALLQYSQKSLQRQWNLVDTVSLSVGGHQFKFGADYRRLSPIFKQVSPHVYYYYFSDSSILADNADGAYAQGTGSAYPVYLNFSAFAQDQWRVTPRLALSLGLRWEVNPAPGVSQGIKPYTATNPNDFAGMTLAPQGTPLWQTSWYNLAPRIGAAYVLNNYPAHETVLKGGAGIFYDTGQQTGSAGFNGPGYAGFNFPAGPLSFPVASLADAPPVVNPPSAPYYGVTVYPTHLQLPYTVQTNLSLEQALGKAQAFTITYVGAFGRKLLQLNQPNPQVVNQNFPNVQFFRNKSSSDYSSLQMQFRRKLTGSMEALASYTWSHCLDYGSQNVAYPYIRGNCDYDVRHSLSSAVSYNIPEHFKNGVARAVIHHWAIDDRFSARSAFPVTLNGNGSYDPITGQFQYTGLDVVVGQPLYVYGSQCSLIYGVQCPGGRAVNVNAFSLPPAGQYGDAPRNFVRGFGSWEMDVAIRREFPIHENVKLQFRAETFNLFNHPSFGFVYPYYYSGSTTFGLATSTLARSLGGLSPLYQAGGPRSMQFALKLSF